MAVDAVHDDVRPATARRGVDADVGVITEVRVDDDVDPRVAPGGRGRRAVRLAASVSHQGVEQEDV